MANKTVCIDEIKGCEGNCITMNDYRVAGPKPWGRGIVVKNWVASVDDVIRALRDNDVAKVVRCKDCVKAVRHEVFPWSRRCRVEDCKFSHKETHFCSYGERREGE